MCLRVVAASADVFHPMAHVISGGVDAARVEFHAMSNRTIRRCEEAESNSALRSARNAHAPWAQLMVSTRAREEDEREPRVVTER